MNRKTVNFTIPAKLSGFTQDSTNQNFSRGKLSVFYIGETEDHRCFTKDFAKELIKSLPFTPVVSYWDAEKEDFVGHATEQQILGVVDPCVEPTFETDENGVEWAVCDVVLYTERPDTVGKLAQKVVGHKQSLELDPKTTKYKVNYDEKKHFKNIEFTAGRFVGVSVLGNDQRPAFTGSEFFACNEDFESKMRILKDYCEGNKDQNEGGTDMNLSEFIKLSWSELALKIDEAVQKEYENDAYTYSVDFYEDSVIVRFYYYVEGVCKLMRINYTMAEDGTITLGTPKEVHVTYEDVEAADPSQGTALDNNQTFDGDGDGTGEGGDNTDPADTGTDSQGTEGQSESGNEGQTGDNTGDTTGDQSGEGGNSGATEPTQPTEPATTDPDPEDQVDNEHVDSKAKKDEYSSNADPEVTPTEGQDFSVETPEHNEQTAKESAANETNSTQQSSASTFAQSEHEELEALKREKKVNLINSYEGQLDEEILKDFSSKVDSLTEDQLELELLREFKKAQPIQKKPRAIFSNNVQTKESKQSELASYIAKQLGR